ncbi:MAG TPA: HNH endonuclease family protein [Mycobacteriales bacterium]|nr:HNH endonuclease family protein [Mycobacteriales bacterium]
MVGIVAIAVALGAAAGCEGFELPADGAAGPTRTGSAPVATVPAAKVTKAKAELAKLPVHNAREGGYQRTRDFGPAWSVDVDHNGCGTRDDILRRDLEKVQLRGRCTVIAGVLADPYTGQTVTFAKSAAAKVQIDHVVPLGAAWVRGARDWTQAQRERFANDPVNLLATTASANESKSDRGPAEWLPRQAYRCAYAVQWVDVSTVYKLALTAPDKSSLTTLLAQC